MANKKELPHNTEAEKAVLGAMLRSKAKVAEAFGRLEEEDFFEGNEKHRAIFRAMLNLYNRSEPVDPQTVVNELINLKELENIGGPEYLVELADGVLTFENFDHYVDIVKEQATLRDFLKTIDKISNQYFTKEIDDIGNFLAESEKEISSITDSRKVGDFKASGEVADELATEIKNLKSATSDDGTIGTPTGFPRLNMLTHGFKPGELIILAARTGVGKTALSLNLAYNAAIKGEVPVAYFSLEMTSNELFKRLVSADADVKHNSLITGFGLDTATRLKIQQSCDRLSKLRFYVDDTAGIKLLDLVAKAKKLKAKEPDLGLIVVDYIGLVMTSSKTKSESRQLEVQLVSQTLKKLAKDLSVPVIGVAQLNRNVESRGGEPQLSDLRESGSIEQDADIVMMLQEMKANEAPAGGKKANLFQQQDKAIMEAKNKVANANGQDVKLINLYIKKNRSGNQGTVPLLFRKEYCRFDSLSKEAESQIDAIESERVSYMAANDEQ